MSCTNPGPIPKGMGPGCILLSGVSIAERPIESCPCLIARFAKMFFSLLAQCCRYIVFDFRLIGLEFEGHTPVFNRIIEHIHLVKDAAQPIMDGVRFFGIEPERLSPVFGGLIEFTGTIHHIAQFDMYVRLVVFNPK